jgi:hypothetical protein
MISDLFPSLSISPILEVGVPSIVEWIDFYSESYDMLSSAGKSFSLLLMPDLTIFRRALFLGKLFKLSASFSWPQSGQFILIL